MWHSWPIPTTPPDGFQFIHFSPDNNKHLEYIFSSKAFYFNFLQKNINCFDRATLQISKLGYHSTKEGKFCQLFVAELIIGARLCDNYRHTMFVVNAILGSFLIIVSFLCSRKILKSVLLSGFLYFALHSTKTWGNFHSSAAG